MNARIAALGVVVASALTLTGCGTVDNMCFPNTQTGQVPMHIYGGLEADVRYLGEDDGGSRAAKSAAADPLKLLYVADLPLSLAADTVTLPVTMTATFADRLASRGSGNPRMPQPGPAPGTPNAPPPQAPPPQEPVNSGLPSP